MKHLIFTFALGALAASVAKPADGTQHILCKASETQGGYSLEFIGHPTKKQNTTAVVMYDKYQKPVLQFHAPINGFADEGFIKISLPATRINPIGIVITSIVGMGDPKEFTVHFSQWVERQGGEGEASIMTIDDHQLTCRPLRS